MKRLVGGGAGMGKARSGRARICTTSGHTCPDIFKPPNPSIDVSELHKIRRLTDFEALKLRSVWSG